MISGKIDVTKIDKNELYQGKVAKYLDIVLYANTDEAGNECPDRFGNDGVIKQCVSKESKAAGKKQIILGNYKVKTQGSGSSFVDKVKPAPAFQNRPKPSPEPIDNNDDIPF